jgi:hypothetical protein
MYNNACGGCVHEDSQVMMRDGSLKAARDVRKGDIVRRYVSNSGSTMSGEQKAALGRVECVVMTSCANGVAHLVPLSSGLRVTAWHPVRRRAVRNQAERGDNNAPSSDDDDDHDDDGLKDGAWVFPAHCPEAKLQAFTCDYVYTFVVVPVSASASEGGCSGDSKVPASGAVYAESLVIDGTECITLGHGIEGDAVASHAFLGTVRVIEALRSCRGWSQGEVRLRPEDFKREAGSSRIHAIEQSAQECM